MSRKVAVVGTGQTKHTSRRKDVDIPHMVREAVVRALEDANMNIKDIDAIVLGSAPSALEGINFPEQWLACAVGAFGKPLIRVHTGGTVGGSTGIAGYYHVASGVYDTCLAVSFEKLSDGVTQYAISSVYDPFWGRDFACGAPGLAALQAREYMNLTGLREEDLALVAVKQRGNAVRNKYAHLQKELSFEEVMEAPVIVSPLKLHDCCPTSDGAAAMIMTSEERAGDYTQKPAWILGTGTGSEGAYYPGMDIVRPACVKIASEKAYKSAGITDPLREIDVAEIYDAFSHQEFVWLEALGFFRTGESIDFVREGGTRIDGKLPVNPSGGVLSTNPIGASGMIRQVEACLQVTGKAEGHQVRNARVALAHAWGGWMQFSAVMIVSSEKQL